MYQIFIIQTFYKYVLNVYINICDCAGLFKLVPILLNIT